MAELRYTVFDTPIGACALGWRSRGICAAWLPEADEAALRRRILQRRPAAEESAPPPGVQQAIAGIVALLQGEARDLLEVPLDLDELPAFHVRVYEIARAIPPGATLSYGEVARRLGEPDAARAVGHALGRNPIPILVPCHRVLAAHGRAGGFSAPGGVFTKHKLLEIEGALAPGAADDGQPRLF